MNNLINFQLVYAFYYSLTTGVFGHLGVRTLPNFTTVVPNLEVLDVSHLLQKIYPDTQGTFCVTAVYGGRRHGDRHDQDEMMCFAPWKALDKNEGLAPIAKKMLDDAEQLQHVITKLVSLLR